MKFKFLPLKDFVHLLFILLFQKLSGILHFNNLIHFIYPLSFFPFIRSQHLFQSLPHFILETENLRQLIYFYHFLEIHIFQARQLKDYLNLKLISFKYYFGFKLLNPLLLIIYLFLQLQFKMLLQLFSNYKSTIFLIEFMM